MSLKSFRNSEEYMPHQLIYEFLFDLDERFLLNTIPMLHMSQAQYYFYMFVSGK